MNERQLDPYIGPQGHLGPIKVSGDRTSLTLYTTGAFHLLCMPVALLLAEFESESITNTPHQDLDSGQNAV